MMRTAFAAMLMLTAVVAWPPVASARTLRVVASFSILADVVRQVGGANVEVRSLIPPDGDPHHFEPSPNDARSLKEADLVFISGENLEGWFAALAKASGYVGAPVQVSNGIALLGVPAMGSSSDSHVWNSLANVKIWVRNIAGALIAANPAAIDDYQRNASQYLAALDALDRTTRTRIDAIPANQRKVLISHNAFGYFARDYGVEMLFPAGLSTETEVSARDIARLIEQIRREKITTYFLQNSGDAKLIHQIGSATGAQVGGKLYGDSLSPPSGPAPTFPCDVPV